MLRKISISKKYVLPFKQEEERIFKKGELNKAVQMAKVMKKDGKTIEEIMKYTELSKEQIEKL